MGHRYTKRLGDMQALLKAFGEDSYSNYGPDSLSYSHAPLSCVVHIISYWQRHSKLGINDEEG
jgi:hypothetical protein